MSTIEFVHNGLASSVDLRTKGYVNEVMNQGSCGSCWAHSACASMEGYFARTTGKLPKLSE
jgi:C1A family cysteine protease